jgi:hypothetical protein
MGGEWSELQLQRMVERVCHQAFYVSGVWIDNPCGWTSHGRSAEVLFPLAYRSTTSGDVHLEFSGESFRADISRRLQPQLTMENLVDSLPSFGSDHNIAISTSFDWGARAFARWRPSSH